MTTNESYDGGHTDSGVRPGVGGDEFVISVNAVEAKFADPVPDGGQILGETGFLPAADHVLIQLLRHGTRSIGLDESVDLRQKGTEAFRAFKSDRVFRFTIDGRGYEWGAAKITEPELRLIAGIADDEVFVLQPDGKDVPLDTGDVVDLGDSCQRRLKIWPRGGAKDCHLGWWSELGVRLGFGDAAREFFGGSGQRSHAELKRSAPAGRPQGGMVYRVGVGLSTRASEARCRPGPGDGVPQFSYRHCFCGRGSG